MEVTVVLNKKGCFGNLIVLLNEFIDGKGNWGSDNGNDDGYDINITK